MKMIIWKELRENAKWAALALAVLALAEFYALSSGKTGSYDLYNNLTMCSTTFLFVTSFGCAIIGAVIGTLQILPELRRDQWASLLHRPTMRGKIFLAKAAAGLSLYLVAAIVPFLASAVYVSTPGQFAAPLAPGMLLAGMSDIFLGMVFYAGALLICLHRGRWIGARGLAALAMAYVFILHLNLGWPFLLPIVAASLCLVAAWGAMSSNGAVRGKAAAAAMTAISLMGSCAAVHGIFFAWQMLNPASISSFRFEGFQIAKSGEVFIMSANGDGSDRTLKDTAGKPVTDERYLGNDYGEEFCQLSILTWNFGQGRVFSYPWLLRTPRALFNYVRPLIRDYESPEIWFHLVRENYFIGYDKLSRRKVGTCGKNGFLPPDSPPEPFDEPLQTSEFQSANHYLYWSGDRLFSLDFLDRTMTEILNAREDRIEGACNVSSNFEKSEMVAVALNSGLRVYNARNGLLFASPYTHDPAIWRSLSAGTNTAKDRIYLQYEQLGWSFPAAAKQRTVYLDEIDLQGKVLQSYSLNIPVVQQKPRWQDQAAIAGTLPVTALARKLAAKLSPQDPYDPYGVPPLFFFRPTTGTQLAMLLFLAVVLAAAAWLCAKRAGLPTGSCWRWAAFVILFGLPGLIAFFASASWPARVPCPSCIRKRPVQSEACPSCGNGWPVLPRTGTEVFDGEIPGHRNKLATAG